jgi:hypothetical protein
VGLFVISGLSFLFFLSMAALMLVLAISGLFRLGIQAGGQVNPAGQGVMPLFVLAWIAGLVCVLLAPALVLSFMQLLGRPLPAGPRHDNLQISSYLMLLWLAVLVGGAVLSRYNQVSWLLLPPLQLLAIGLPIWWLIELGRRGLAGGGPLRNWGLLSLGLAVGPTASFVAEVILLGVIFILFVIWMAAQPGMEAQLTRIGERVMNAGGDLEVIGRIMRPVLERPAAIVSVLLVGCGLIPLLEELIKPLPLWGLAGRKITPAAGFTAGLICGGAFALLEGLGNLANPVGDQWLTLVIGRAGTSTLHIVTTGLVGWGIASAWQNGGNPRRSGGYLRLGATYLLAAGLHGIWNAFGLLNALPGLLGPAQVTGSLAVFSRLGNLAPYMLSVLVVVLFLILLGMNRRLQSESVDDQTEKIELGPIG